MEGRVLYHSDTNTCTSQCPDLFYTPDGVDCLPCSDSCLNCLDEDVRCTSCPPSLPYLFNDTCYSECPVGYFEFDSTSPKRCLECDSASKHCESCNNFETCASCLDGFYLYQSQCLTDCPNDITVENLYTW